MSASMLMLLKVLAKKINAAWAYCSTPGDISVWSHNGIILTGENQRTWRKTLSQCYSVNHKSHTDWPGLEPGPLWWKAGD
jgi:hypothetical protein